MKLAKFAGSITRDTYLYIFIIAVSVVIIGLYDKWLGLAGVLVLVYLLMHNMRSSNRKKRSLGFI